MNILITGASGGIGQAIVQELAKDDIAFFLQFNSSKKAQLTANFSQTAGKHHYLNANLLIEKDIDRMLNYIEQHNGVDVIIHAVSLPTGSLSAVDKTWTDFEAHMDIQVKSLFQIVKRLGSGMRERKFGRVIAVASEYTVSRPPPKLADYVTSKYALVGLIKSLAVELGQYGITVNCVSPGLVSTELTRKLPNKLKEIIALQTPTKRLTTPKDVAVLVKFLSSREADMITGENLLINGGYVMR